MIFCCHKIHSQCREREDCDMRSVVTFRYGSLPHAFAEFIQDAGTLTLEFDHFKEIALEVGFRGNPRRLFSYYDRQRGGQCSLVLVDTNACTLAIEMLEKLGIAQHLQLRDALAKLDPVLGGASKSSLGSPNVSTLYAKSKSPRGKREEDPDHGAPTLKLLEEDELARARGRRAQRREADRSPVKGQSSPASGGQHGSPTHLGGRATLLAPREPGAANRAVPDIVLQFKQKIIQKYHSLVYGWRMLFGANNDVQRMEFFHVIKNLVRCEYVGERVVNDFSQENLTNPDAIQLKGVPPQRNVEDLLTEDERNAAQREAIRQYLRELWKGLFLSKCIRKQLGVGMPSNKDHANSQPYLKLELLDPELEDLRKRFEEDVNRRWGSFVNLFDQQCFQTAEVMMDLQREMYWTMGQFQALCNQASFQGIIFVYVSSVLAYEAVLCQLCCVMRTPAHVLCSSSKNRRGRALS